MLGGYVPDQLAASGTTGPQVLATVSALTLLNDVAMDANGNAWVVGAGSNNVFRLPAAALAKSGTPQPDLVIQSAALSNPANLVFDASGSLWVANRPPVGVGPAQDGSIVRLDIPAGASGTTTLSAVATITSPTAGDLFALGGMAFDGAQNLWVTSFVGILRFDNPRARSGAVAVAPGAIIDKTGYSNDIYFYSIAFDASGALWTTSSDGIKYLTSVTKFRNPGALHGRSSPAAAVTIQGVAGALPAGGLAFDGAGNLWTATAATIDMYADPGALSGMVTPSAAGSVGVGKAQPTTNSHVVFFPAPVLGNGHDGGADGGGKTDAGPPVEQLTFSNVTGTAVNAAPFVSPPCCRPSLGIDAGNAAVLSILAADGRVLTCELAGEFLVGSTFTLANSSMAPSKCTYSQPGGAGAAPQWISNGGTLTVSSNLGPAFTFTLHAVTMAPDASIAGNPAAGTFTLDGAGVSGVQ